jgi:hypothetical protein
MAEELVNLGLEDRPVESIDSKNYAKNSKALERFTRDVVNQFQAIRSQRRTLTNKFIDWQQLWQGVHTQRLYEGRSDIFVPRAQKVVETHVTNTVTRTFPIDEKYEIFPTPSDFDPQAELAVARADMTEKVLDHLIEESRLRSKIYHFVRMGYILGTSVMRTDWETKKTRQYRRQPVLGLEDSEARLRPGQPRTFIKPTDIIQFEGVRPKTVDLVRWFIHPVTVEDIDDYEIIFEEADVDINELHSMKKRKSLVNVDEAIRLHADGKAHGQSESNSDRQQRRAAYGLVPSDAGVKTNKLQLTKVYARFPLYLEQGVETFVDCEALVLEADGGQPLVLFLGQNQEPDQRPPYRAWKVRDQTDNFYGQGLLETLEAMQYALNAFMNQSIDMAQWAASPMLILDTLKFNHRGGDINIAPLGVMGVRGKPRDAFDFFQPPDTTATSVGLAQILGGMMDDSSAATSVAQARSETGKQSATESQILANAAAAFQDAAIQKLEMEVLTPMLKDWYLKAQHRMSPVADPARQKEALMLRQLEMDVQLKQLQALVTAMSGQQMGTQPAPQSGAQGPAAGPSGATPTSPANRPFTTPEGTI